jgi:hypothetical protein
VDEQRSRCRSACAPPRRAAVVVPFSPRIRWTTSSCTAVSIPHPGERGKKRGGEGGGWGVGGGGGSRRHSDVASRCRPHECRMWGSRRLGGDVAAPRSPELRSSLCVPLPLSLLSLSIYFSLSLSLFARFQMCPRSVTRSSLLGCRS